MVTGITICCPVEVLVIRIEPEYVPAGSVPGVAIILSVAGMIAVTLPEAPDILSQLPPAEVETVIAYGIDPAPWFDNVSGCEAGLAPAVKENEKPVLPATSEPVWAALTVN
jgi:hypothetical protein